MPSPPKDRSSGRLGRFLAALRPSRAGPLPVQTGFPTSLADLVVKNHGRLKKQPSPSSKRGRRAAAAAAAASPSPSPCSPTTSPSPSPSPPPASPPPPAAAAAVSPSDRPRPDLPPAQPPRGFGLGFLAVSGVVSLALLVIWSKKVVAAVTVAAFSLYLLESVRSSSLPRRRPRPRPGPGAAERRLCLDGRGRVSPIREVDAADTEPSRPSCSDSDRASEAEGRSGVLDESSNTKAKARNKSWKKLLAVAGAKKLQRGRRSKEADSSGSFRSDGDREDAATACGGGGNARAADSSGSRRGSASQSDVLAEDGAAREADSSMGSRRSQGVEVEIDADVIEVEEEEEQAGTGFPALVLVAVVLVGLVAGKAVALALTVLCSAFLSSDRRSPCGGGGGGCSQGRRLEPSMP
ncbi:hypothetical protein Zm00014a_032829 [Zea mays]|jgi:hypothetical protein|uniref:Uncharacterized protein n=2 Tax=Zea mays TaxID=4577 RepID=A0A1D6GKZ4_MAIZE|nr:hypothetical protein ZEAMMB73_Zm00001d013611 [Zea mays]PWZ23825.1 hypothetical protein Zm00014a_032829 [Zea mays]